jgi:hypothetical protein
LAALARTETAVVIAIEALQDLAAKVLAFRLSSVWLARRPIVRPT